MDGFRAAVFAKLNGASALTNLLATTSSIYHRRAPLDAAFPLIIMSKQSGVPVWTFNGRPMENQVWLFKGVDRSTSSSNAEDISKQLDVVLTDTVMTLSDGELLYLRKEDDVDYAEETDPDFIIHNVGGMYRTIIDRA